MRCRPFRRSGARSTTRGWMLRLGGIGLLGAALLAVLIAQSSPPATASAAGEDDGRASAADESPAEVRDRLERMSPEEREALRRRSERFYHDFTPEKQQRLRDLHQELSAQPDEQRLREVLTRYTKWLQSLTPKERSELLALPVDERIARIKELKQEQETRRFRGFANLNLAPEDFGKIYDSLDDIIARNEEQLLARLSPERREFFTSEEDDHRRRRRLMFAVWSFRGPPEFKDMPPLITQEDIDALHDRLSSVAKAELDKADTPEKRLELVRHWGRAALFTRFRPDVDSSDLEAFFETLPSDQQQQLEQLPRDQMIRELRQLYFASQVRGDGGGFRGFGGRDGGGGRFSRGRGGFGSGGGDGQGRRGSPGGRFNGDRPPPPFPNERGERRPPPDGDEAPPPDREETEPPTK